MEIKRTPEFREWLDGLRDVAGRARIQARIERLAAGNPGDHRNLEGGISEMRVDVGPGYRVYTRAGGDVLIVLLVGGDKASQKQDIRKAQALAADL
jgi:putative addiction module killer protein